jgi:hypothetical protein
LSNRFDVKGYVAGFGNPDWASTHEIATSTAPTVLALLNAGATCVGKTIMDEMAYRFAFVSVILKNDRIFKFLSEWWIHLYLFILLLSLSIRIQSLFIT